MSEALDGVIDQTIHKPSVLLIDDDPLITESLGFILTKHYQVSSAESRAQAKLLLANQHFKP